MSYMFILPAYFAWHYGDALADIMRLWTNYIWFFYNFFSIPVLLKTLFSPWQRIQEGKRRAGFHMEDMAEVVVTNMIMRFVGFLVRAIFIVLGTIVVLLVSWVGVAVILLWIFLPAVAVASFVFGLSKII